MRTTPDVFGFGLLDAVPQSTILALADPEDADGDGISRRVNRFFDGRVGRFGRKALTPTLAEFAEGAFHFEQGVTVPNVLGEGTVGGQRNGGAHRRLRSAPAPAAPRKLDDTAKRGQQRFASIGCAPGHVPTLRTGDHPIEALVATPSEFRTEPLVALRLARRYRHDGRAGSIEQAIRLHGGEATRSRDAFAALSESDRKALVGFLESL